MPIGRIISFVLSASVGIWAICSGSPHDTSPVTIYIAAGLFVLLGVALIISIVSRWLQSLAQELREGV